MPRVPGTFKQPPPLLRRDLSTRCERAARLLEAAGALHVECWTLGLCTITVAREPYRGEHRWHLSIAHPTRYPTWDELKTAAFGIEVLQGVMLAQVFTPGDGSPWVNVHENCFHLYEIHDQVLAIE